MNDVDDIYLNRLITNGLLLGEDSYFTNYSTNFHQICCIEVSFFSLLKLEKSSNPYFLHIEHHFVYLSILSLCSRRLMTLNEVKLTK